MQRNPGTDNSGVLFDHIKQKKKLRWEGDLATFLGEQPTVISEIRRGRRHISAQMLVRICDKTGMSLKTVQAMIAQKYEAK